MLYIYLHYQLLLFEKVNQILKEIQHILHFHLTHLYIYFHHKKDAF